MTMSIPTKFNFKPRKITDTDGKEVGKTKKQPSFTVELPQPTAAEIVAILSRVDVQVTDEKTGVVSVTVDKEKQLVLDSIQDIIRAQAKSQLDDVIEALPQDSTETISASALDYDKLSLSYIANLPPAQRGAKAIPDEDWEALYADYMQVMVAATGKPESKIKNHIDLFKKPARVKANKDALTVLVDQLDIYLTSSQNVEETGEAAGRLQSKFKKWLEEDAKLDLSAL